MRFMNRLSIRLQIALFTLLLAAGVIGYGSYVLLSTQRQIRDSFRQNSAEALHRIAAEIAAPLWLRQSGYVSNMLQYAKTTPHLRAVRLLNEREQTIFDFDEAGADSLLRVFGESGRAEWTAGGFYFVHRAIAYKEEPLGRIVAAFDESPLQTALGARRRELGYAALLLAVFALLLLLLGTYSLAKPVRRIRQTLSEYEPQERYPLIHLPEEGPGEVVQLIHTYNKLADRVGELFRTTRTAYENARGFFADHPLPMLQTDALWNIQDANEGAAALFQLTRSELAQESLEDLLNPGEFLALKQALRKSGGPIAGMVCGFHGRLGRSKRVELYIAPRYDAGQIICNYLITLIDVDEKLQAQQKLAAAHQHVREMNKRLAVKLKLLKTAHEGLQEQQKKLQTLIRAAEGVLAMTAPSNILETFRNEGCQLLAAQTCLIYLLNRVDHQLLPALLPPLQNFRTARKPAAEGSLVWLVHQTGKPQIAEGQLPQVLGDAGLAAEGRYAILALPLAVGERKLGVAVLIRPDTHLFSAEDANWISLLTHNTAVALEKSELIRELGQARRPDPQPLPRADSLSPRHLQQAFQAQKMESLEILVGGIAHDFNNILGIINPNVDLLRMKFGDSPEIRKRLIAIQEAVDRAAHLTRQLVIFTRNDQVELQRISPNRLVERLVSMIHRALGDHITVKLKLAPDIPAIHADETKLSQALVNLAVNARDAMPGGGVLTFRTALDSYLPPNEAGAKLKKYVKITVSDTGQGIPEQHLYKIFDPFFTTKTPHRGAGMGLAVVYGIIKSHNGFIAVDTEVNKGTAFHIYLEPVMEKLPHQRPEADGTPLASQKARENILVVDDERMIRESLSDLLKLLGYNVYQAVGGRHAMEILKHHRDIDAAIVDFAMPQMNGIETIKALRRINSRVKFVLSSGYADQEKVVGEQQHIEAFLPKPFQLESLSYTFSKLFSGHRPTYQKETT